MANQETRNTNNRSVWTDDTPIALYKNNRNSISSQINNDLLEQLLTMFGKIGEHDLARLLELCLQCKVDFFDCKLYKQHIVFFYKAHNNIEDQYKQLQSTLNSLGSDYRVDITPLDECKFILHLYSERLKEVYQEAHFPEEKQNEMSNIEGCQEISSRIKGAEQQAIELSKTEQEQVRNYEDQLVLKTEHKKAKGRRFKSLISVIIVIVIIVLLTLVLVDVWHVI